MADKKQTRKRRHHARKAEHPLLWKLKMWFVPHKQNAYRPNLIDRYSLGVVAVLCGAVFLLGGQGTTGVLGQQAPITPVGLLGQTNIEREKAEVSPLKIDTQLMKAAALKAKDMIDHDYWAHTSPDGVTPWHWIQQAGYSYAYAGENLARNFASDGAVVAAWMASDGHRENMLHPYYTEVGFAIMEGKLDGKPSTVIVAVYATPADALTDVASVHTSAPTLQKNLGAMSRLGVAVQSMNPAILGLMIILTILLVISLTTAIVSRGQHSEQTTFWRKHHGVFKVAGIGVVAITIIVFQGMGQII